MIIPPPPNCLWRDNPPPCTPVISGRPIAAASWANADDFELTLARLDQSQIREAMLTASLAFYAGDMIMGPPDEPYCGRFHVGRHHIAWDELVQQHRRILIKASRDHGKTFCFSVAYPIWRADKSDPGALMYIFSANQTLAEERLAETRQQIETNDKLAHLVPHGKDALWNKREMRLTTGSVIRARGWGVRVRGGHPKYIVEDDILDDDTLYSETKRRRATEYHFSVPSNMITPGGQIVVVGTPFHQQDVYAAIEATGKYAVATFPAFDEHGEALFSIRYDKAALESKREEIGTTRFAREFMCCRPGTMIETERGPVPIERVAVDDLVLTHTGAWKAVLQTFSREFIGNLRRIKGRLHVTDEHPILTQDGFVPAALIVDGDAVTFPTPEQTGRSIETISFQHMCGVPYLVTEGGRIYARGSARHLKSGSIGGAGSKSIPAEIALTPKLMRLLGLWLAEGNATPKLLVWSFGENERATLAAEVVALVAELFGLEARISDPNGRDRAITVSVGSVLLCDWFRRMFPGGARGKRVPRWMRNLSPDLLWPLCLGYIDGDGHVDAGAQVRVSSVSEFLLRDVQFLLARCALFSTLRQASEGGYRQILGRRCWCAPSWTLNLDGPSGAAVRDRGLPQRMCRWGRIHGTLELVPHDGPVYNLEVAGDNSYVADGIAVHNCKPLTDEASYFPSRLFSGPDVRLPYVLGLPWSYWAEKGCERYVGVDIAMSAEVGADYFVMFTIAVDEQGVRYVANIRRHRGLGLQAQLDLLRDENALMRPAVFHIEANQAQRIIPDEAIRTTDLPIRRFFTTGVQPKLEWKRGMTSISMGKHNLDRGVPSLRMSLESKKWRIPRGDPHSIEMTDIWIGEMGCISFEDGRILSVGEHDDTVMACWFADVAVRVNTAQAFTFVEPPEETRGPLMGPPKLPGGPADPPETADEFPDFDPFSLVVPDKFS